MVSVMVSIIVWILTVLFICGFVYWCIATVIKDWIDNYNVDSLGLDKHFELIQKKLDGLKMDNARFDSLSKKNAEMIGFRILKLTEKLETVKTDVEKVAENVVDSSVDNEPEEMTYEQMMQNYFGARSEDYRFQVSRLKKQLELIETDYETLHNKFKKLEDENRKLKLEMQVVDDVDKVVDS